MQKYLKLCYRDQVLPLPILSKIDSGALALEDYTIRQPQVQSLSQVIKHFNSNAFRKVYLNNNGLNDVDMAEFLEGFITNKNINQLEIAYNRVQDHAIRAICNFFLNKRITVLKMMQTKTNQTQAETLFECMKDYTKLTELKLQNFNISTNGAKDLGEAINNNLTLKLVDLSYNQIQPASFDVLMKEIAKNNTITEANFSFISTRGPQNQSIVDKICHFIKHNKSLLHLNLSNMSLEAENLF